MDDRDGIDEDGPEYLDEHDTVEVIDLDELLGDPDDYVDNNGDDEWEQEDDPEESLAQVDFASLFPTVPLLSPSREFSEHQGSSFCVDLDNVTHTMAVSGGEDDKAFVWNTDDGVVKFICTGHKDSVTHVGISHDGTIVFSADMSGDIKVWKLSDGLQLWETQTSDLKWVRWHQKAHVLFATTEDGSLYMWQIPGGQCKVHQASGSITAAEIFPDGKRTVFAHGSGTVSVLDLKDWKVVQNFPPGKREEDQEALCVDVDPQGSLIAVGMTDGTVRVLHSGNGKIIKEFRDQVFAGSEEDRQAIESVSFSKSHPWLAVAGLNGTLCVYDVPTQTTRHTCSSPAFTGITKMVWIERNNQSMIALGHLKGVLSIWDAKTGSVQLILKCQHDDVLDLCVSGDGQRILAACDNGIVNVFELGKGK